MLVGELNTPVLTVLSSCLGIDFSVCLWDIYTGSLVHRFSSHGGEVSFDQRDSTELLQRSVHRESPLRWNVSTRIISVMVWLYISPVWGGGGYN